MVSAGRLQGDRFSGFPGQHPRYFVQHPGIGFATRGAGYGEHDIAGVEDAPMASLYGLAPRSIPTVRTSAEEQARKVVRLSRPKGKAGQRKKQRR